MKVFISWSGTRSRSVAEAIRGWLPRVLQSVQPWMSDEDISAGSRWLVEISGELSASDVGIVCVTPENQISPWLLFESGALSKALVQTHVCPLLFDMSPGQLSGPLAQFQANDASRDGLERIVNTINKALKNGQLASNDLSEVFDVWWPKLAEKLEAVPPVSDAVPKKRSTEDLLEEIVANTREQLRRENVRLEGGIDRDKSMDLVLEDMRQISGSIQSMQEFPKVLHGLLAARLQSEKIPELSGDDTAKLLGALMPPQLPDVQRMIESARQMSENNQQVVERLLKPQEKNVPDK